MKKSVVYVLALLLVTGTALVAAQGMRNQPRQYQPDRNQPEGAIVQRGQAGMGGMGMMGRGMGMGGQGMGMMNRGGMRGGAGMQGEMSMMGGDDMYLNMREQLKLDDTQVKKLKQIRLDLVKTTGDVQNDLQVARLELQDLLDADKPDMKVVEQKISAIHGFEAKLETERLRARYAARDVLTPEQREQIKSAPGGRGMMRGMMGRGR
jgi:Spy/CpxP family protein refolding chaperone